MKKQYTIIALVVVIILLLAFICRCFYWSSLPGSVVAPPASMSHMMGANTSSQHYPASNTSALDTRAEAKASTLVSLSDGAIYAMSISEIKKNINGKVVPLLAYNDSIPGPTIRVQQDSTVHIKLTNNLNMATTLHPHGLRTANAFDGVPDITQKPIQPGETFTYDLTFPDPGVYWYHPHLREDFTQDLGLAGNFLVVPKDTTYWNPVEHEWTALVDDMVIDANHPQLTANNKQAENALMGTYGNTMLVNGEANYQWQAKQGERARFYITNAANVRPFNLTLDGLKMKLVGADNGKYEQETWQEHIVLSPGERAVVETYFDQPGTFILVHKTPTKTYQIASINVAANSVDPARKQSFEMLHGNPDIVASIDPFRPAFDKPIDKALRLTMDMPGHSMMGGGMMQDISTDGIEWEDSMSSMNTMMSGMTQWEIVDEATGKKNMNVQWQFQQGDHVKMKITNDKEAMHPMQHPVHLHGQRFLVLSQNGKQNTNLVWKDTVLIPAGDTVEILVDMSSLGNWMLHCHISEHVENGMMMGFTVNSVTAKTALPPVTMKGTADNVKEKVYVALEGDGMIGVINGDDYSIMKKIPLSTNETSYQPHNVQVAPDGQSVWVTANVGMDGSHGSEHHTASTAQDQLFVIDPSTDEITKTAAIAPEQHLAHVVLTPDSKYAFISAQSGNKVYQIDTKTFQTTQTYTLPINSGPHGIRSSPDGKYVYAALYEGKGLLIIDVVNEKQNTISLPGKAVQVAIIPNQKQIAVSLYDTKQVALVDVQSKQMKLIKLPSEAKGPVQMYASPNGQYLYVADQGYYENQPVSNMLYRIDLATSTVDKVIPVGQGPHGVVVTQDGSRAFITDLVSNEVSVVDTKTNQELIRVPVGKRPNGISVWSQDLGGTP